MMIEATAKKKKKSCCLRKKEVLVIFWFFVCRSLKWNKSTLKLDKLSVNFILLQIQVEQTVLRFSGTISSNSHTLIECEQNFRSEGNETVGRACTSRVDKIEAKCYISTNKAMLEGRFCFADFHWKGAGSDRFPQHRQSWLQQSTKICQASLQKIV